MSLTRSLIATAALSLLGACSSSSTHGGTDGGHPTDSGAHDATVDGAQDGGTTADADATVANDAANTDAAVDADAGMDTAAADTGVDAAAPDATIDSGGMDAAADSAEADSALEAGDGCAPAPDGGHYVGLAWNEVCADMVTNFTVEWGQAEGGPYPDSTDAGYSCDASACDAGGQLFCNYNLYGLDAGGWCIAVEACDNGTCSALSGEVCVQIPAPCP
jgi:hypothetical protein